MRLNGAALRGAMLAAGLGASALSTPAEASSTVMVVGLDEGDRLVDTHADVALPGPPAALRVGSQ